MTAVQVLRRMGLEVVLGDIVTTIDGVDVSGANYSYGWTLMRAPVGTKLRGRG